MRREHPGGDAAHRLPSGHLLDTAEEGVARQHGSAGLGSTPWRAGAPVAVC
ncbi:hypothetical protein NMG29_28395 [Streptomyces cocklensis]|nr:hypothetical protein [Actinacidiphila cocklensis]